MTGMAMEGGSSSFSCSGSAWDVEPANTGTWTGHVVAGVALLLWALHWNFAIFRSYLTQSKQRPFCSAPTYPAPLLPPRWPVEALLKLLLPTAAILANLLGPGGWHANTCPQGTPRVGHFDPQNIYRYANVWALAAFAASGLVDLLGWFIELPEGTESFFTSTAFLLQSFLLVEGQYTDMLQDMVYYVQFLVSTGTAFFIFGEIIWPHSFFASCGRVYCTYVQGIWYFNIAHMLYEGRVAWDTKHPVPDMAPAAFVPVPFVFWMNMTGLGMFLGFLAMKLAHGKRGYGLVDVGASELDAHGVPLDMGNGSSSGAVAGGKDSHAMSELVPLVARNI